jgi:hypothetical protein
VKCSLRICHIHGRRKILRYGGGKSSNRRAYTAMPNPAFITCVTAKDKSRVILQLIQDLPCYRSESMVTLGSILSLIKNQMTIPTL